MSEEIHEPQSILGKEKIEWRGTDSKVFEKVGQPGEFQLVGYENPVHYKDEDGKLQDIDCTVVDGVVEKAPYIAKIMKDKIGLTMTYRDTGQRIDMVLRELGLDKVPHKKPHKIEGNIVEYEEVVPNVDILFVFEPEQVRIYRILKNADAPTNVHFESIIDNIGAGATVLPKFFGADAKKREIILETKFEDPIEYVTNNGTKVLRQHIYDNFTKETIHIDEKTRIRTVSDEVEYPVHIDPTITKRSNTALSSGMMKVTYNTGSTPVPVYGSIISNNGASYPRAFIDFAYHTTGGPAPSPYSAARNRNVYHHFVGITIPMGAIINTAVLTSRVNRTQTAFKCEINAVNDKVFGISSPSAYTSPATILSKILDNNFVKTTPTGTKNLGVTYTPASTANTPGYPTVSAIDVKPIVQRLVDQFDYNNNSMFFQVRGIEGGGGTDLSFFIYTHYLYSGAYSPKATTSTSQATSVFSPKLVIDFSVAVTQVDSLVDAILVPGVTTKTTQFTVDTFVSPDDPNNDFEVAEAILDYLAFNGDKTGFQLIAEVINPVTGRPYNTGHIKNAIGYLNRTGQITGNPYVPPPNDTGAYNFKKTTWTIV